MSVFVTEITTEIGMKIDRGCYTQSIITVEIDKTCFMMTILLLISVVDFHDWNRQSMFHDVDYRDWNRQALAHMHSGHYLLLSTWCTSRSSDKHAKRLVFFMFNLYTQWCKHDSNRMYSFCASVKNATHYGVGQAFAAAPISKWRASQYNAIEPGRLCLWLKPRLCRYQSKSTSWNTFIKIAMREFWLFSLWFLKSKWLQFQNEQWAFGNWNRLDFKIIMISVSPIDTVKQGSLNKPCANSGDFQNDFSLRKIDTVNHGVVELHYENRHHETMP